METASSDMEVENNYNHHNGEEGSEIQRDEDDASVKEEPCGKKQMSSLAASFFYRMDREVHHFVGEDIIIQEALDSFAATTWPAGVALSHYLEHHCKELDLVDKAVLEIGAGTGLVAIVAALLGAWVTATDLPHTLGHLRVNVCKNTRGKSRHTPQVAALPWGFDLERSYPASVYHYDYIMAADVVYHHDSLDELLATMKHFCQPGTKLIWANKIRMVNDLEFVKKFIKTFNAKLMFEDGDMKIFMATYREEGEEVAEIETGNNIEKAGNLEVQKEEGVPLTDLEETEDDEETKADERGINMRNDIEKTEDTVDRREEECTLTVSSEERSETHEEEEEDEEDQRDEEIKADERGINVRNDIEKTEDTVDKREEECTLTVSSEDRSETDEEEEEEKEEEEEEEDDVDEGVNEEPTDSHNQDSSENTQGEQKNVSNFSWTPSVISSLGRDIYHFVGTKINIFESIDSFGAVMWPAALALCSFLENNRDLVNLEDKKVLELGAGTGLVAIVASLLGAKVTATDLPDILGNLRANVMRNTRDRSRHLPEIQPLSWSFDVGRIYPSALYRYDYVLAADVVYHHDFKDELLATMVHFCHPRTTIILANKIRMEADITFMEKFKKEFDTTLLAEDGDMKIFMGKFRM